MKTLRLRAALVTCRDCINGRIRHTNRKCPHCQGRGYIIHDRSELAPITNGNTKP